MAQLHLLIILRVKIVNRHRTLRKLADTHRGGLLVEGAHLLDCVVEAQGRRREVHSQFGQSVARLFEGDAGEAGGPGEVFQQLGVVIQVE